MREVVRAVVPIAVFALTLAGAATQGLARQPQAAAATPAPAASASSAANGAYANADAVARGRKIAFDRSLGNCLACHTMKGGDVPSNVGPRLFDLKQKFPDRKKLYAILYDEEKQNRKTVMPPFGKNLILTPQQISDVVAFLYTE
jgi:sulfur-oxidizing protein SoxX